MHCPVCKCYCHNEELEDCPTCGTAYEHDNTDLTTYSLDYVDLGEITEKADLDIDSINRLTLAIKKYHPAYDHGITRLNFSLVDAAWLHSAIQNDAELVHKLDPFLVNLDKLINLEG